MADAIDFAIALNVQHGSNYENIELHFGFSREEENLFNGENSPTVEEFKRRANEFGSEVMKDFVHEALQYVEFNDNLDIVDFEILFRQGMTIRIFYLILIRIIYSINLRTVIFSKFNRNIIRL